jgi:hypothetical protein
MIVGALVALVASVAVRRGLLAVIEELRKREVFDPLVTILRRMPNNELVRLQACEPSSGPRANAILQEIDRRGLDG